MSKKRKTKPPDLKKIVTDRMEELGYSKYRVAQLSGVPRQTLGTWLAGETSITADRLAAVLAALDLEVTPRTPTEG